MAKSYADGRAPGRCRAARRPPRPARGGPGRRRPSGSSRWSASCRSRCVAPRSPSRRRHVGALRIRRPPRGRLPNSWVRRPRAGRLAAASAACGVPARCAATQPSMLRCGPPATASAPAARPRHDGAAAGVGAVADRHRRDERVVGAGEACRPTVRAVLRDARRSWRRSCRPRCWCPRRSSASPTYDRCGTLAPSPIWAFLVSTKAPILPPAPSRVPGPEVGERADGRPLADDRQLAVGADDAGAGADLAVGERGVGPDHGVLADDGGAEQLGAGQDRDVRGRARRRRRSRSWPGRRRSRRRASSGSRSGGSARGRASASWTRSLTPSVCATSSISVGADRQSGVAGEPRHVGEVVLALGVVVADPRQRVARKPASKAKIPQLISLISPLLGGGVLLLDDRRDVAVRRRGRSGRSRTGRGTTPLRMLTARCAASCSATRARRLSPSSSGVSPAATTRCRRPVVERLHRDPTACPVPCCFSWTASTASGSSPAGVGRPARAGGRPRRPPGCGCIALHGRQDVPDHAAPADRVQHLRGLRLHAGAAARGQHDHGQVVGHARQSSVACGASSARARSPGRSRTYVASPDSKSGGPCRQTNRG